MRTVSQVAADNAIPVELKKDGLQQRQNGDWVIRFVIQASDMNQRLSAAAMGSRFMAALVEVNDDETPKTEEQAPRQKRNWMDLNPAAQAGIRCGEPAFSTFLKETRPDDWHESQDAAECVRLICGVRSRVELGINHKARMMWKGLDDQYQVWDLKERVGA